MAFKKNVRIDLTIMRYYVTARHKKRKTECIIAQFHLISDANSFVIMKQKEEPDYIYSAKPSCNFG